MICPRCSGFVRRLRDEQFLFKCMQCSRSFGVNHEYKSKLTILDEKYERNPDGTCFKCGKVLKQKSYEHQSGFKKRKYCGITCYRSAGDPEERDCHWCGSTLVRREDEPMSNFKSRKTCDRNCGMQLAAFKASRSRRVGGRFANKV